MKSSPNLKATLLKKYKVLTLSVPIQFYSALITNESTCIVKRPAGSICDMLFTNRGAVRKYDYVLVECLNSYIGQYAFFEFKSVIQYTDREVLKSYNTGYSQWFRVGDYQIMLGLMASIYTGK